MVIAVASGKGGTGKTTVSVSLAEYLAAYEKIPVLVSDADVEAPNAHLFLKPGFSETKQVEQQVPRVREDICSGCGTCAEVCQFNAIVLLKDKPRVFPSLCHGCGSCTRQCPEGAIEEVPREIGKLERGYCADELLVRQGLLAEGEPMAVPVISDLKRWGNNFESEVEIIDSPPGASCPVVEAIRGSDYVLLVTEPTPFGLHDLKQALQVTRELGLPAGVILNRAGLGEEDIQGFCKKEGIPMLMEIPLDRKIGEGLARGESLLEIDPAYRSAFSDLWTDIQNEIKVVGL